MVSYFPFIEDQGSVDERLADPERLELRAVVGSGVGHPSGVEDGDIGAVALFEVSQPVFQNRIASNSFCRFSRMAGISL